MRCNIPRTFKGSGHVRFSKMHVAHALLVTAVLTTTPLFAQSNPSAAIQSSKPTPPSTLPDRRGKTAYDYVNDLADLSRAGNADATRELTRQTFRNGGIKSEIADSFGFTDRIVQAEATYRNGAHASVHEADIVKAINNLANTVGAPAWVQTNQAEVRKVRMRLLVAYPHLTASHEPPDASGNYKALSENISPVEATYIAITLLYQKHYNADFQFTDEEQAQNAKADAATLQAKHMQRTQTFGGLLRGPSSQVSVRDLQIAADYFFDDLGIERTAKTGSAEVPTSSRTATQKGAH